MENNVGTFGPILKVRLSNPHPRPFVLGDGVTALPGTVEVDALVSARTAMTSVLPELIRFPLGLRSARPSPVPFIGAAGHGEIKTYEVDLEVVGGARFVGLEVSDGRAGADFAEARGARGGNGGPPAFHVILGRDVLRRANLI